MVLDRVGTRAEGVAGRGLRDRNVEDRCDDPRCAVGDVDPRASPESGHLAETDSALRVLADDHFGFARSLAYLGGAERGVADVLQGAERSGGSPGTVADVEGAVRPLGGRKGRGLARRRLRRRAGAADREKQSGHRDDGTAEVHEDPLSTRERVFWWNTV